MSSDVTLGVSSIVDLAAPTIKSIEAIDADANNAFSANDQIKITFSGKIDVSSVTSLVSASAGTSFAIGTVTAADDNTAVTFTITTAPTVSNGILTIAANAVKDAVTGVSFEKSQTITVPYDAGKFVPTLSVNP